MLRLRDRIRREPSATRWAGRSIPTACRSSGRPRFCNCCWEISAGRAAGFWRCADMLPFRVRPISPRSTTSCPATCRCRCSKPTPTSWTSYIKKHSSRTGLWANFDKYIVSLLKAWYGDAATSANNFGFDWLPRVTGDHSHFGYWYDMLDGKMEGLFVMGQNPAVGAPNGRLQRTALAKLKWLVVRDMVEIETASFWYDSPEVERGKLSAGRRSRPKCFSFLPRGRRRKPAHSPTRNACCSFGTRRSTHREMRAAKPGSCITWAAV